MYKNDSVAEIQISYNTTIRNKVRITTVKSAYDIFLASWSIKTIELYEDFKLLLLNRANNVIGIYHLSKGGVTGTVVDTKLIFAVALKCNATGIILCHNHPSGNLHPSEPDKNITQQIKKAASLFDINLLDHLIISKDEYFSFSENALI